MYTWHALTILALQDLDSISKLTAAAPGWCISCSVTILGSSSLSSEFNPGTSLRPKTNTTATDNDTYY